MSTVAICVGGLINVPGLDGELEPSACPGCPGCVDPAEELFWSLIRAGYSYEQAQLRSQRVTS